MDKTARRPDGFGTDTEQVSFPEFDTGVTKAEVAKAETGLVFRAFFPCWGNEGEGGDM